MTKNPHTTSPSPRNAPEPLINLSPKEGMGNAGCPWHPRPRVDAVQRSSLLRVASALGPASRG
jgi:hypothetical protein